MKYKATFGGKTTTRNSKATYTHAWRVVCKYEQIGFAGSEDNAMKNALQEIAWQSGMTSAKRSVKWQSAEKANADIVAAAEKEKSATVEIVECVKV